MFLQVTEELTQARQEVARMQKERERYEEMMKKAFMRGVCALNLEAMTIFNSNEEKENRDIGMHFENYSGSIFYW